MNYDNTKSKFYQKGIKEFEKKRDDLNRWITKQSILNEDLFVQHTFQFHYIPKIIFEGTKTERTQSLLTNYFDKIDFNDSLIIYCTNLKEWMTNYINIWGTLSSDKPSLDSLLIKAGDIACKIASEGHPKVYGWMVDYFYYGYETHGMNNGIAILEKHIENPNCLASKKQQIIKRLKGLERLKSGTKAPNFFASDNFGDNFEFYKYQTKGKYKLLLFWSADCGHCEDLIKNLAFWYNSNNNEEKIDIIAVSLDETETEVPRWEKAIVKLPKWKHLRPSKGINSTVANNYAVVSTPSMFLIDNQTNNIKSIPANLNQMIQDIAAED